MIASAVMGGAGMWISAFSLAACVAAVGAGAFLSVTLFGRERGGKGHHAVEYDPTLWRLWGIAGALACLFFYLLEYFPHDMGIQMEVNNPLLALAWWGAGELLCRFADWRTRGAWRKAPLDSALVALSAASVATPAVLAMWGPAEWFAFRDPFAWRHHQALYEFKPFSAAMYALPWRDHLAIWGLLPLALVPGFVLLFWKRLAPASRGVLAVCHVQALVLGILFIRQVRWGVVFVGPLQVLVLCLFVLAFFGLPRPRPWAPQALAAAYLTVALGVFPSMKLLGMWRDKHAPGDAFPVWTPVLVSVVALACLLASVAHGRRRRWPRLDELAAGGVLAATFGVFMGAVVYGIAFDPRASHANVDRRDVASVVLRDIAGRLNAMSGPGTRPVVLSDPNSSLLLAYFGNLRAVGTNYWTNLEGLKASAAIYSAQSDDARELLRARQVRYIVLFSEGRYAQGYFKTYTNGDPRYTLARSFAYRMNDPTNRPDWLRSVPYPMPPQYLQNGISVQIYEVLQGQRTPSRAG